MHMNVEVAQIRRYAIFQNGGKQYQAIEGKTVSLEKIDALVGETVTLDGVLLRKLDENTLQIGRPVLDGAITAEVVKHMRGPKLIIFKFKRRKKSRVKKGHRQPQTIVRITSIM